MAYSDRTLLKYQEAGGAAGLPLVGSPQAVVSAAHSETFLFSKAADDGAAATATAETFSGLNVPRAFQVNSITYNPVTGGITADPTNNAVISVYSRDAGGLTQTLIGTLTTNVATGNIVQGQSVKFTLPNGPAAIVANGTFTFAITKGGTGVVVRQAGFTVDGEYV